MNLYELLSNLSSISLNLEAFNSYKELIENNKSNKKQIGFDHHHILPKSLFPEFKNLRKYKENGVYLDFVNHLEAHRLLALITNDIKMKYSYHRMAEKNKEYFSKNEYAQTCKNEYITYIKSTVMVKDSNNNKFRVYKNDPRYLSGELVSHMKGMTIVLDNNGDTFFVSVDDPRYLSGELVGNRKGMINVLDLNGNTYHVQVNDPRLKTGELVYRSKNKAFVIDKEGNKFFVDKNDPRYLSGELVGHTKGMISARHSITGETCSISKTDPRYISGEYIGISKGMVPYNNGIINKRFFPGQEPEGFVRGMLKSNKPKKSHSEDTKRKISEKNKGKPKHSEEQKKKWRLMRKGVCGGDLNSGKSRYNNGVNNKFFKTGSEPSGYVKGWIKKARK